MITSRLSPKRGSPWRGIAAFCLLAPMASCVPGGMQARPALPSAVTIALPPAGAMPAPPPAPLAQAAVPLDQALAANAAIPLFTGPNPAALPFRLRAAAYADRLRAQNCLADAIFYEARSESEEGQRAVAQVVLNRVRHPAYPRSVCGVVYEGVERPGIRCQFSFACDGSLLRAASGPAWDRAHRLAALALAGSVYAAVGNATHYHTFAVSPGWGARMDKVAIVGAHIFYRLDGGWGAPAAFRQIHAGREPGRSAIARQTAAARAAALPVAIAYAPQPDVAWAAGPAAAPLAAPVDDRLPQSTIREEYHNSGRIRASAE